MTSMLGDRISVDIYKMVQGSRKQVMQLAHRERMRSGRTVPSENR